MNKTSKRKPRGVRYHLIYRHQQRCPRCGKHMFLSREAVEAALERLRWRAFFNNEGRGEQRYYACSTWEGFPVYHLTSQSGDSHEEGVGYVRDLN